MPVKLNTKVEQGAQADASVSHTQAYIGSTVESNSLHTLQEWSSAIMETPPTPSFLKDSLFQLRENWWGEQIAVDYMRGTNRVAPYCTAFKRGIQQVRERFVTRWVSPPDIKMVRDIRALDARYRTAGHSPFSNAGGAERIAELQVWDYTQLDYMITRREELQCAQVLTDGVINCYDGDEPSMLLQRIEFGPINRVVIDEADYWDTSQGDPIRDLTFLKRHVNSAGYGADMYILGVDAASAFLANQKVREGSNFLNYRQGVVDVQTFKNYQNFGVTLIGNHSGMDIVSYEGMYESPEDGKMHYYLSSDSVIVASSQSQNRFCYGRVTQVAGYDGGVPAVTDYNLPRVPQYVVDPTSDQLLFRLWSRPLACPVNTLTWAVATCCELKSTPFSIPQI